MRLQPYLTPRIRHFLGLSILVVFYVSLRTDRLLQVASPPWYGGYIDEVSQIVGGLHILEGVTPGFLMWPATLYTFVLGTLNGGHLLVKLLSGSFGELQAVEGLITAGTEYFLNFYRDPRGWFIAARIVSLTFGMGTLICVYATATVYVGRTAGFVAAVVYALLPLERFLAQVGVAETASAFFAIAAMGVALRVYAGAGGRTYLLLGLLIGLGLGTKYTVAVLVLPAVLIHFLARRAHRKSDSETNTRLQLLLFALVLSALVANPFLLTQPVLILKELAFVMFWYGSGTELGAKSLLTTVRQIVEAFGTPALVLACIGVVLCVWRRRWELCFALCLPPALVLLAASSHSVKYHRHLIIIGPFVAILAGLVVQTFVPVLRRDNGSGRKLFPEWIPTGTAILAIGVASVLMLTCYPKARSSFDGSGFSRVGRLEAWIEASVPQHSRIVFWDVSPSVERNLESLERTISRLDSRRISRDAKWQSVFPDTSPPTVAAFDNVFTIDEQVWLRSFSFMAELRRRDGDRGYDVYEVRTRVVSYGMPADSVAEFASASAPTYVVFREFNAQAREELSKLAECYRADGLVVRSFDTCTTPARTDPSDLQR